MGMAASQARFLGLTARKNNVEFEGQQINQQRTALSNQSANYYNDLLGMAVPVPPSVDDYTKTVYTFTDGALENEITGMIAKGNGNYTVSYLRQWVDDFAIVSASTSIVNNSNNEYRVGANKLRKLGDFSTSVEKVELTQEQINALQYGYYDKESNTIVPCTKGEDGTYTKEDGTPVDADDVIEYYVDPTKDNAEDGVWLCYQEDGKYYRDVTKLSYDEDDEYIKSLSESQLAGLIKEELQYLEMCKQKYGNDDYYVRYIKNSTTGEYNPYFYKAGDLKGAQYDANGNSLSNINCFKIGSQTQVEEVKAVEGCKIEKDSSGRLINLTIPNGETSITYALTTSTVTDQGAYEDAMNQYEYEKYEYDQAIQEINSKIEIIQAEDKNLELRLKQLDTEHTAIQTEVEAVSSVIKKNTESTFKTFG